MRYHCRETDCKTSCAYLNEIHMVHRRKHTDGGQTMLHVRVDDKLKAEATEKLTNLCLTVSDTVRILLTRVAKEGAPPVSLTADPEAYDACFRTKVEEALPDKRPRCYTSRSYGTPKRRSTGSVNPVLEWRAATGADLLPWLITSLTTTWRPPKQLKDDI
jgi:DNA-damage-inducible protein J